jgi:hypothetical protein
MLQQIKRLCTPAYIYLVISVIFIIISMIQNAGNKTKYCIGSYECGVQSTPMVFVVKMLYIIFWTFVLNSLCKAGYKNVSWFLVLLPFILFFILIGLFMLNQ